MSLWDRLAHHHAQTKDRRITDLFEDPERAKAFSLRFGEVLFDYSKTGIDGTARELLIELAEQAGVAARP